MSVTNSDLELFLILNQNFVETKVRHSHNPKKILFESRRLWHKESLGQTIDGVLSTELTSQIRSIKIAMPGLRKLLKYRFAHSVIQIKTPSAESWSENQTKRFDFGNFENGCKVEDFETWSKEYKELPSSDDESQKTKKVILIGIASETDPETVHKVKKWCESKGSYFFDGLSLSSANAEGLWKKTLADAGVTSLFEDWKKQILDGSNTARLKDIPILMQTKGKWVLLNEVSPHIDLIMGYYEDLILQHQSADTKVSHFDFSEETWAHVWRDSSDSPNYLYLSSGEQIQSLLSLKETELQPTSPLVVDSQGRLSWGSPLGWEPGPMISGRGSVPLLKDFWDLSSSEEIAASPRGTKIFQTIQALSRPSDTKIKTIDDLKGFLNLTLKNFFVKKRNLFSEFSFSGTYTDLWPQETSPDTPSFRDGNYTVLSSDLHSRCTDKSALFFKDQILHSEGLQVGELTEALSVHKQVHLYSKPEAQDIVIFRDPTSGSQNRECLFLLVGLTAQVTLLKKLTSSGLSEKLTIPPIPLVKKGEIQTPFFEGLTSSPLFNDDLKKMLVHELDQMKRYSTFNKAYFSGWTDEMAKDFVSLCNRKWSEAIQSKVPGEHMFSFSIGTTESARIKLTSEGGSIRAEVSLATQSVKTKFSELTTQKTVLNAIGKIYQTLAPKNSGIFSCVQFQFPPQSFLNCPRVSFSNEEDQQTILLLESQCEDSLKKIYKLAK